ENAQSRAVRGVARREDEHRLRQSEFARDCLHRVCFETGRLEHDRQRIADKPRLREDIEGGEAALHNEILCEIRVPAKTTMAGAGPAIASCQAGSAAISFRSSSAPRR